MGKKIHNGVKVWEGLPRIAYAKLPSTGETILVKLGESGFYTLKEDVKQIDVEVMNKWAGVTPAQAEAMFAGSMFGWECDGANPAFYETEDGKRFLDKERRKAEGEQ